MPMQLLFPLKRGTGVQIDEAVRHTATAFGRRSNQDCLLISLCRHAYLRRLGIFSKILLITRPDRKKCMLGCRLATIQFWSVLMF